MGKEVHTSDTMKVKGTDLYITGVDWSHMGRYDYTIKGIKLKSQIIISLNIEMIKAGAYMLPP